MESNEIIKQLEYLKTTTNQTLDAIISQLKSSSIKNDSTYKPTVKPISNQSSKPIKNDGWFEVTGNAVELPTIEL